MTTTADLLADEIERRARGDIAAGSPEDLTEALTRWAAILRTSVGGQTGDVGPRPSPTFPAVDPARDLPAAAALIRRMGAERHPYDGVLLGMAAEVLEAAPGVDIGDGLTAGEVAEHLPHDLAVRYWRTAITRYLAATPVVPPQLVDEYGLEAAVTLVDDLVRLGLAVVSTATPAAQCQGHVYDHPADPPQQCGYPAGHDGECLA